MKFKCFVVKNKPFFTTEIPYVTYGIVIKCGKETVVEIPDVSSDLAQVKKLCCLCNRLKLGPNQLKEVVEDMLDAPHKPE